MDIATDVPSGGKGTSISENSCHCLRVDYNYSANNSNSLRKVWKI